MRRKLYNAHTRRWVFEDGASASAYLSAIGVNRAQLVPHFADPSRYAVIKLHDGTMVPTPPPPSMKHQTQNCATLSKTPNAKTAEANGSDGNPYSSHDLDSPCSDSMYQTTQCHDIRRVDHTRLKRPRKSVHFSGGVKSHDGMRPETNLAKRVAELLFPLVNISVDSEEHKRRRVLAFRFMRYEFSKRKCTARTIRTIIESCSKRFFAQPQQHQHPVNVIPTGGCDVRINFADHTDKLLVQWWLSNLGPAEAAGHKHGRVPHHQECTLQNQIRIMNTKDHQRAKNLMKQARVKGTEDE